MKSEVVKQWRTESGYIAQIVKVDVGEISSLRMSSLGINSSWFCGYVNISKSNSLFGKNYNEKCGKKLADDTMIGKRGIIPVMFSGEKNLKNPKIELYFDVHGGITFAGDFDNKDEWWFGFDCAHCDDNPEKCDLKYVGDECERLSEQLLKFEKKEKRDGKSGRSI